MLLSSWYTDWSLGASSGVGAINCRCVAADVYDWSAMIAFVPVSPGTKIGPNTVLRVPEDCATPVAAAISFLLLFISIGLVSAARNMLVRDLLSRRFNRRGNPLKGPVAYLKDLYQLADQDP